MDGALHQRQTCQNGHVQEPERITALPEIATIGLDIAKNVFQLHSLAHIAPLTREHVSFNGDYIWPTEPRIRHFCPLRKPRSPFIEAG